MPRILLSPFYFINEYVFRRPLGALVRLAERDRWAQSVEELVTFGPNDNDLLVPTALFDFGLLPSVGLYYAGNDNFAVHNSIRLHAATWGPKWLDVTAADRYTYDDGKARLQARFEFKRSEDNLFLGIGPDVRDANRSRYGLQRMEGGGSFRRALGTESFFDVGAGLRRISYVSGTCCSDVSLDERIADGSLASPPGYGDSYTDAFQHFQVTLDSRSSRPEPGSGLYLHVHEDASLKLAEPGAWVDYGGVVGGALDLDDYNRTMKLQLGVDFVDALQGGQVPFNELTEPGTALMPGFITGWMHGNSMVAAQLGYTWPIWAGIDGQLRVSAGNAFGTHLDDFAFNKLRMSGDVGFTTAKQRDQGFEVLFGLGTETFEQGGGITSVRVTVGSRSGL